MKSCGILSLLLLLLTGCNTTKELYSVVDVSPKEWFSPVEVSFELYDNSTKYEMQVSLRYGDMICSDSVEIIVETIAPDGVSWSDPLTIQTPHQGDLITIVDSDFRRDIKWCCEGRYRVIFYPQHLYRGVTAVGVNLRDQ